MTPYSLEPLSRGDNEIEDWSAVCGFIRSAKIRMDKSDDETEETAMLFRRDEECTVEISKN